MVEDLNINNKVFRLEDISGSYGSEYNEIIYDIIGNRSKMLSVYRLWQYIFKDGRKNLIKIGIQSVDDKKRFQWQFKEYETDSVKEIESIILDLISNNNIKYYYCEASCIVELDRNIKHKNSFGDNPKEFLFKKDNEYVLRHWSMDDTHEYIVLYDDNVESHYFEKVRYPNGSLFIKLNHTDEYFDYLSDLYWTSRKDKN